MTLDSWVGRIETVNEDVTLLFPDGARFVTPAVLCDQPNTSAKSFNCVHDRIYITWITVL